MVCGIAPRENATQSNRKSTETASRRNSRTINYESAHQATISRANTFMEQSLRKEMACLAGPFRAIVKICKGRQHPSAGRV
jgi:hypothetical protein